MRYGVVGPRNRHERRASKHDHDSRPRIKDCTAVLNSRALLSINLALEPALIKFHQQGDVLTRVGRKYGFATTIGTKAALKH